MLVKLSPFIRRQAQRLCRSSPSLIDDAYSEGRIRIWELLQNGIDDEAYLLRSSANRIRNFLAHERYEPKPFHSLFGDDAESHDAVEAVADSGCYYEEALCRAWLSTLGGTLRSALEKELFTREAKTDAERVALHRFRRSDQARDLARSLSCG